MNITYPSTQDGTGRKDVLRAKRRFGLVYGIIAGLSFAIANWGMDAVVLSQAHALHPWLKVIIAIFACIPVGGLTGWLASRIDKPFISMLLWLVAGSFFAWLSVANTFQLYPSLLGKLNPEIQPYLQYSVHNFLQTNGIMSFIWMSIFWSMVGLLQIPLLERAVYSLSFFSKVAPLFFCMVLVLISGLFLDNMNNERLRSPILALDETIQFAIDVQGKEVDRELSRKMRLASVRAIQDWLGNEPRYYFVGSFDEFIGQVNVIVNFGGSFAECTVVYNQTSFCKPILQQ